MNIREKVQITINEKKELGLEAVAEVEETLHRRIFGDKVYHTMFGTKYNSFRTAVATGAVALFTILGGMYFSYSNAEKVLPEESLTQKGFYEVYENVPEETITEYLEEIDDSLKKLGLVVPVFLNLMLTSYVGVRRFSKRPMIDEDYERMLKDQEQFLKIRRFIGIPN